MNIWILKKDKKIYFSVSHIGQVQKVIAPVLGILIGVAVTLMLVALVIMLILKLKYNSSQKQNQRRDNR